MNSDETELLVDRAMEAGGGDSLGTLLERYGDRLTQLLRLRINAAVLPRVSVDDALQEVLLTAIRSFGNYDPARFPSFYLWLRKVALRRISNLNRFHMARVRDVKREIQFLHSPTPNASTFVLAERLLGRFTSPSQDFEREEQRHRLLQALNELNDTDREIIALRDFEGLANNEAAHALGIEESAASRRHLRAMVRLGKELKKA